MSVKRKKREKFKNVKQIPNQRERGWGGSVHKAIPEQGFLKC